MGNYTNIISQQIVDLTGQISILKQRLDKLEGKDNIKITDIIFKFHNVYFKNYNDVVKMLDGKDLNSLADIKNLNYSHNITVYVDSDSPFAYVLMYLLNHLVRCGYEFTDFSMNNIHLVKKSDY